MAYFVYGTDRATQKTAPRFSSDATNEADARRDAEAHGIQVMAVVAQSEQRPVPAAPPTEAEETAAFKRTLATITPRVVVTYALILANFAVFVAMCISGADFMNPRVADLLRFGAEYGPLTTGAEPWRLFTALFVHIGFQHLIYNLIALTYVGPVVERMLGNVGFLVLYVVAGLCGSLWAVYLNPLQVSAGASGAVFGIYGALFALLWLAGPSIPEHVRSSLRRFVLLFVGFNAIYSLLPRVSFAAHFGGIVAGFLAGMLLAQPLRAQSRPSRLLRNVALVACGAVVVAVSIAGLHARYRNLDALAALLDRANVAMSTFSAADKRVDRNKMSDADFASLIEGKLLPEWRSVRASLTDTSVPATFAGEIGPIVDYMRIREDAWNAAIVLAHEKIAKRARDEAEKQHVREPGKSSYFDLDWDLPRAEVGKGERQADLDRLRELWSRIGALRERSDELHKTMKFEDYDGYLETELLPKWTPAIAELAGFKPVPQALREDVAEALRAMRSDEAHWLSRVADRRYDRIRDDSRAKNSAAFDAALAIKNRPGARLRPPY